MTVINPKSISGINSITTGSGSDDLLTIHNNSGAERFRVDGDGNTRITSGIITTVSVGAITGDISIDDKILHTGDTNTAIRFPSADTIQFETSGEDRLKIDSNGIISVPLSGVVAIGNQSGRSINWSHSLQVEGTDAPQSSISIMRNSNDVNPPYLTFCKSRGTEVGATTVVANNDLIGSIQFKAADGNAGESIAAGITAEIDGTPGDQDTPGRLVFKTTPDGSASVVERLRMNSVGKVGINSTAPDGTLSIEAAVASAPVLTMRNHPAGGVYSGNYGVEYRHAYGSVNHGMLVHTEEADLGRRALDVSDSGGVFATFVNGKVGIKSDRPAKELNVTGEARVQASGDSSSYVNIKNNQIYMDANGTGYLDIAHVGGDLQVRSSTSSALDTTGPTFKSNGNLAFASGKGIDFSATSGTGSTELFDDYEEGTWTGAIAYAGGSGWSTTEGNGKYIKIGHLVHCTVLLSWNEGSGTGAVTFSGLPFSIKNDSHTRLGGHAIYLDGFSNLSGSNIFLYNTGNSTQALMYYVSGDNDSHLGPSDSDVTEANTSNSNTTRFMFHYQSA